VEKYLRNFYAYASGAQSELLPKEDQHNVGSLHRRFSEQSKRRRMSFVADVVHHGSALVRQPRRPLDRELASTESASAGIELSALVASTEALTKASALPQQARTSNGTINQPPRYHSPSQREHTDLDNAPPAGYPRRPPSPRVHPLSPASAGLGPDYHLRTPMHGPPAGYPRRPPSPSLRLEATLPASPTSASRSRASSRRSYLKPSDFAVSAVSWPSGSLGRPPSPRAVHPIGDGTSIQMKAVPASPPCPSSSERSVESRQVRQGPASSLASLVALQSELPRRPPAEPPGTMADTESPLADHGSPSPLPVHPVDVDSSRGKKSAPASRPEPLRQGPSSPASPLPTTSPREGRAASAVPWLPISQWHGSATLAPLASPSSLRRGTVVPDSPGPRLTSPTSP
jgi:hypothetical protein